MPFSRESSSPTNQTWISCIAGRFFTIWATREVFHMIYSAYKLNNQGDSILPWCTSFPMKQPISCFMSDSNCCFLSCIQVSQDTGKLIWYSCLLKNFPQFIVIHTVKGFGIVNKAEIDVFLELSCFFWDPTDVGNMISGRPLVSLL